MWYLPVGGRWCGEGGTPMPASLCCQSGIIAALLLWLHIRRTQSQPGSAEVRLPLLWVTCAVWRRCSSCRPTDLCMRLVMADWHGGLPLGLGCYQRRSLAESPRKILIDRAWKVDSSRSKSRAAEVGAGVLMLRASACFGTRTVTTGMRCLCVVSAAITFAWSQAVGGLMATVGTQSLN